MHTRIINIGLALAGLIFGLLFLLSLELPLAPSATNSNVGYTCYGVECVDPYPTGPDKWNYSADYCEKMVWQETFKLNHNTTRTIFHRYCYL